MISYSPCKLNIGLEIISKRADGFHNLETVMYPVPLYDIIEIDSISVNQFEFTQSGILVNTDTTDNLVYKAWTLLNSEYHFGGIKVHLHKQIPMGAGLGGGSANAATMIKMLNQLFNLSISNEEMEQKAAQLGSDCPFFIRNTPVFAYNTGTDFLDLALNLSTYHLVIIKPDVSVSTQQAYSGIKPKKANINLQTLSELSIDEWQDKVVNQFENHIFSQLPELEKIKEKLYNYGAVYSAMSGSGSAIYGLFKSEPNKLNFDESYFVWQGKLE